QRAIDKAENPQQRFNKSVAETDEAARKAAEEIAKLRREFERLGGQTEIKGLQQGLEDAIEGVDRAAFDTIRKQIEQQFREVRTAELTEKSGKAVSEAQIAKQVGKEWEIASKDFEDKFGDAAERAVDKLAREQEQAARQLQRQQEETY